MNYINPNHSFAELKQIHTTVWPKAQSGQTEHAHHPESSFIPFPFRVHPYYTETSTILIISTVVLSVLGVI